MYTWTVNGPAAPSSHSEWYGPRKQEVPSAPVSRAWVLSPSAWNWVSRRSPSTVVRPVQVCRSVPVIEAQVAGVPMTSSPPQSAALAADRFAGADEEAGAGDVDAGAGFDEAGVGVDDAGGVEGSADGDGVPASVGGGDDDVETAGSGVVAAATPGTPVARISPLTRAALQRLTAVPRYRVTGPR